VTIFVKSSHQRLFFAFFEIFKGLNALTRGLTVLELFTLEAPSLTLTEIIQTLKLSKSTAFRVVSTLEAQGYIEKDPSNHRYRPSLKVLQLGFTAINSLGLRQIARPYLERLALEANETVSLCVLNDMDIIYVDRVRNHDIVGVMLNVGSRLSAHCTALGKVLLADLPPEELSSRLAQTKLEPCTSHTIVNRESFLGELAIIRQRGYAIDDEELAFGLRAVAAPIRDASQKAIAAINVTGSVMTMTLERIDHEFRSAVMKMAEQISSALGYSPDRD